MVKKKLPVVWDTLARKSLHDIYLYYQPLSAKAAKKLVKEILKCTRALNVFPQKYPFDPLLLSPYRFAVVRHYKIIYTIAQTEIRVVDIYDTRQDPSKLKDILD